MPPSTSIPWYRRYPAILEELSDLKKAFQARCEALGQPAETLLSLFRRERLARIVHESNWQEGVELEIGRTRELAEAMMDEIGFREVGRLDLDGIVSAHRSVVLLAKRSNASMEEIATMNLSRAHVVLNWIAEDLAKRQSASLAYCIKLTAPKLEEISRSKGKPLPTEIARGLQAVANLETSNVPIHAPLTGSLGTEGELVQHLLSTEFDDLLHPMNTRYVHALHRLTMMGCLPPSKLGAWRRGAVHVGNPDISFAPASAVESLMAEFCRKFPTVLPGVVTFEPCLAAAKASYRFVRIHPYADGNGRVSRLLMNLVLWGHHPFVSLAPKSKGTPEQPPRRTAWGGVTA